MRSCVACRTARPKRDLVRVVRTPDGDVRLDATGKVNGRGAYLCADGTCWRAGLARRTIEHALGAPVPEAVKAVLGAGPAGAATLNEHDRTLGTPTMTIEGGTIGKE